MHRKLGHSTWIQKIGAILVTQLKNHSRFQVTKHRKELNPALSRFLPNIVLALLEGKPVIITIIILILRPKEIRVLFSA